MDPLYLSVLVSADSTIATTGAGRWRTKLPLRPAVGGARSCPQALGQHEIAVVQTTALDEATRTVRLNTLLAHSSKEWIASDWPVCPLSDINAPQRMGAALTYARRYGLFTLVGIAGEDDLDAPDLNTVNSGPATAEPFIGPGPDARRPASGNGSVGDRFPRRRPAVIHRPILPPGDSARLREGMLAEIGSIASSELATAWANTMLRAKNTLNPDDARSVERAFETKLAGLAIVPASSGQEAEKVILNEAIAAPVPMVTAAGDDGVGLYGVVASSDTATADTTCDRTPPITKTVRRRSKEHLNFVRVQPCLICAKQPSDAHHLTFAQPRALGRKVSDEYAVPLCRAHHRELHRAGKEIPWWQSRGIAPLAMAETLWRKSQSGEGLSEQLGRPKTRPSRVLHHPPLAMVVAEKKFLSDDKAFSV